MADYLMSPVFSSARRVEYHHYAALFRDDFELCRYTGQVPVYSASEGRRRVLMKTF